MLNVQEYLQSHTLEDLATEFSIKVTYHETLPLVILNYHQIDSPKSPVLVRECRGLVLDTRDFSVVARAFNRFFNWGEMADEKDQFNFSDFSVAEKHDGSLFILYNFEGQWIANTRNSFGNHLVGESGKTWTELFCEGLGVNSLEELTGFDTNFVYIFELCSPHNKVVRQYHDTSVVLLTVYHRPLDIEVTPSQANAIAEVLGLKRPNMYDFNSIDEIIKFLQDNSEADPTFEGVVIWDGAQRWKIKSATYLALHQMRGSNGENLYSPKTLVPIVLAGELDEVKSYFPEVSDALDEAKAKIDAAYQQLRDAWAVGWAIPVAKQKDFALAIVPLTPFNGILFNLRKVHKGNETEEDLKVAWRNSADAILKYLYKM